MNGSEHTAKLQKSSVEVDYASQSSGKLRFWREAEQTRWEVTRQAGELKVSELP